MTSATLAPIIRAVAMSVGVQGSDVPSTTCSHCANERRGESSLGSSSSDGDLNGLPPQVIVRTRSRRNQISNSLPSPETCAAATPAATPVNSAKAGASAASARRRVKAAGEAWPQPFGERADLLAARRFADRLNVPFENQRGAAGAERQQQRAAAVEQRAAPVAVARKALDHPLLEPPRRQLALTAGEAFERGDAGADGLADQFAHRAHLERQEAR